MSEQKPPHIYLAGNLLKILQTLPEDQEIRYQTVGQDGSAWNMEADLLPIPDANPPKTVLRLSHADIKTLRDVGTIHTPENNLPLIVCAANRLEGGRLVLGARHFDMLMHRQFDDMVESGQCTRRQVAESEQGFVDNQGNFHNRDTAMTLAQHNGQIRRQCGNNGDELFSEHLY